MSEAPSDIGLVERFGLLARLGKHADALEGDPRAALWVSDIREARSTLIAKQAEIDGLKSRLEEVERERDAAIMTANNNARKIMRLRGPTITYRKGFGPGDGDSAVEEPKQ